MLKEIGQSIRQSALNEQMVSNEGEKEMCPGHPDEELKMLCATCQKVVCVKCIVGKQSKHAGHAFENVTELYCKKKEEIDSTLNNQVQVNIGQLETVSDQLQTMEDTVKLNGGAMKQEIDTRAEDLIKRITIRRNKLKKIVDKEVGGKVIAIRQQRDTVRHHINKIMTAREQINKKFKEWGKVKIVANSQQLLDMATDTQTTGLVKEAGKTRPELDIVFRSTQLNGDETMLGQIIGNKPRKNNVIEMWQLCKEHIRSPELSKHLMNSVVLAIAVLLYCFSPLLGLIVMALITLHATLEYNSIDKSIRIDRHQVWCNDMEATLPESLKVFAIVIGAFTGVSLFYFLPWLYSIVCIASLIAGLFKAINSMGLVDKSEWLKKLAAYSGAVIVVLLYYYQPLLGLCVFVLGASIYIYINSGSFDVKVLSTFWVEFAMTITLSFILLQSATLKIIGHIVRKSGKSNVTAKMLQRHIFTPKLSNSLILLAVTVVAVILYHYYPLLGLIVMASMTLCMSLEYNHIDKSMRVNNEFKELKDGFPVTMPEWLKVFAAVTGTIAGIPLLYSFPWLYSITCIIGLLVGLYYATDDFIIQYGPINVYVPPNLSESMKVFMSVIGTTVMVILHIYHPWFGLCGILLVILICVTTIGIIHRSVASIETFSEIMTSITFITILCGLLLSQLSSVRITVTIFNRIPFFHTKKL